MDEMIERTSVAQSISARWPSYGVKSTYIYSSWSYHQIKLKGSSSERIEFVPVDYAV